MAVKHIRANSADYAPFLDEDTPFESHGYTNTVIMWPCVLCDIVYAVGELSKDGTYAGNDAIVAVSRSYGVNVVIHQLGVPDWVVQSPSLSMGVESGETLHIAYLRGDHYCAVRSLQGGALPKVVSETLVFMRGCYAVPPSLLVATSRLWL